MPLDNRYIILKQSPLSIIQAPIRSTQRIKYTCFEVSQKYLMFGATSGGLYVFRRSPCTFLHLIPTKEGLMAKISISKDERFIALASVRGTVCVLEWDDDENKSRLINRSLEHSGSVITEMVWADTSNQLYIGDSFGRLSVINVSLCMSKSIFQLPAFVFMELDSGIIQVSCQENYLLVSTEKWCYICDTTKEHYKQIGSKMREGEYGACFFNNNEHLTIYSARPGSRLWEVNINGTVLSTHQLKKVLATQPTPIITVDDNIIVNIQPVWPEQPFNFCYLGVFMEKFILTYKSDGIYIFDPISVNVVLWTNHYYNISCVKSVQDTIYIWTSTGELHFLVAQPIDKCLLQLYFQENYKLCIQLCNMYLDDINFPEDLTKLSPLAGLKDCITHENKRLMDFLDKLSKYTCNKPLATRLDSGIFLVENRHWKKWKISENRNTSKKKRPYNKSCSLPHDIISTKRNVTNYKLQNTISLPDFHFALEQLQLQSSETPDKSKESTLSESSNYRNVLPKIPFLSLASPDIFYSTISELHHNVSGKFNTGTKSLKSKWQSLEGRFKFLLINSNIESCDSFNSNEWKEPLSKSDYNGEWHEDDLVERQLIPHNQIKNNIDVTEIIYNCNAIANTENPNDDLVFKLFDSIISKYQELYKIDFYNAFVANKTIFPFNEVLPVDCINIIKRFFHLFINKGKVVKYLQKFSELHSEYFNFSQYPELIINAYSTYELKLDYLLRNVLYIFSELIDPFTILYSLEMCSASCIYLAWSVVLDTFQESAFSYITSDESTACNYGNWPLPLLLNTIYLMFRLQQVESSYHMSSEANLKFYHISYLFMKLTTHFESTGMSKEQSKEVCNEMLLKYVAKLLDNKKFQIHNMFDFTVAQHIECAFLELNLVNVPICVCGHLLNGKRKNNTRFSIIGTLIIYIHLIRYNQPNYKMVNKHLILFDDRLNHDDSFINSLLHNYVLNKKNNKSKREFYLEEMKPMKEKEGFFSIKPEYKIFLHLIQAMPELISIIIKYTTENIMEIIPFIVQYGKFDILNDLIAGTNEKFWTLCCDYNLSFSKGKCCICSTKYSNDIDVDWNTLAITMLKHLTVKKATTLLKNYAEYIPTNAIDFRFYRACILSNAVSINHPKKHASLIDVYCNKINNSIGKEMTQESNLLMLDDVPQYTPSVVHSVDSTKWGIHIDINSDACGRCALLLNSKKLVQDGLRAFQCGHIYHIICLRLASTDYKCPVCLVR